MRLVRAAPALKGCHCWREAILGKIFVGHSSRLVQLEQMHRWNRHQGPSHWNKSSAIQVFGIRSAVWCCKLPRDPMCLLPLLAGQPALPVYASAKDAFFYKIVAAQIRFILATALTMRCAKASTQRWEATRLNKFLTRHLAQRKL